MGFGEAVSSDSSAAERLASVSLPAASFAVLRSPADPVVVWYVGSVDGTLVDLTVVPFVVPYRSVVALALSYSESSVEGCETVVLSGVFFVELHSCVVASVVIDTSIGVAVLVESWCYLSPGTGAQNVQHVADCCPEIIGPPLLDDRPSQ